MRTRSSSARNAVRLWLSLNAFALLAMATLSAVIAITIFATMGSLIALIAACTITVTGLVSIMAQAWAAMRLAPRTARPKAIDIALAALGTLNVVGAVVVARLLSSPLP